MLGLLIWGLIAAAAVVTICVFVDWLSVENAKTQITQAAHQEDKYGFIQAIINSTGDKCAKFSLSKNGSKFADLHVNYGSKSSDIYSGKSMSVYA